MAANKRTKIQREADLETIARLYLQKKSQREIAQELGLHYTQITYDLKEIQKRWLEASVESIDKRKSEELARIDRLERVYWDAWEKSIGQFTVTTKTAEGGGGAQKQRATVKTEDLNGDPRYLAGIQWCIEMRAKIIGIKAPEKHEHTGKDGGAIKTEDASLDDEGRIARLASIFDAARERRDRQTS